MAKHNPNCVHYCDADGQCMARGALMAEKMAHQNNVLRLTDAEIAIERLRAELSAARRLCGEALAATPEGAPWTDLMDRLKAEAAKGDTK